MKLLAGFILFYGNLLFSVENLETLAFQSICNHSDLYLHNDSLVTLPVIEKFRKRFNQQSCSMVKNVCAQNMKITQLKSTQIESKFIGSDEISMVFLNPHYKGYQICTINELYTLYNKFGFPFSTLNDVFSTPENNFIHVSHDWEHGTNYFYIDMSECYKLQDFFENKISFSQMLLLCKFNLANKQNKFVRLSPKEKKIFEGLLPEIKSVLNRYIDLQK